MGTRTALAGLFATALCLSAASAGPSKPRRLPDFSLRDPVGRLHTRATLARDGVVLVVTAPTVSEEDAQRGWDAQLRKARPRAVGPRLVFVEDLDQSWFPDMAVEAMKESYVPGQDPVLLLDRRGSLRRALGVGEGATVVLVFDARGLLVHAERGEPATAAARRVWAALAASEEAAEGVADRSAP